MKRSAADVDADEDGRIPSDEEPVVVDAAELSESTKRKSKKKKKQRSELMEQVDEATAAQMAAEDAAREERRRLKKEKRAAAASAAADGAQVTEVAAASSGPRGPVAVVTDEEIAAANPKQIRHEVSVPAGYPYVPLGDPEMPAVPARQYPFTLDPFQRYSVAIIERNESVLVSAHTSAGKTVVAEYAIAVSLRNKQRVIYTSPIKALSNQKYRELQQEFGDVGLMTGDVSINPSASCLVMTTEILRNMLYRGSEIMREVAWVVFDEIHYMRDKERGVVWEESIIMLPKTVHHVFLSATIPNAREFADWICRVHGQPCHVVYTDYRPTPLQHYLFPAGSDGIFLAVDEKGRLREDNFAKAMALVADAPPKQRGKGSRGQQQKGGSDIYKIIKMTMERGYQPVIVFAFSKRECEGLGLQLSKLDFNSEDEKKTVEQVFHNAIDPLSEEDKGLPQIEHILPLLRRGIGIHHGGLLPIIKEVIEILFQEGLVKVLFATETFSMGLNMPARTVVFTSVRKFDGKDFRWVSSGEYTQMAGRAGRRGLDDRGIVIQMLDEKIEPDICRKMLTGGADNLTSAFHLSYNMILNLMRVEDVTPEYLLDRSFFQFQNNASIPGLEKKVAELEASRDAIVVPEEQSVSEYYSIQQQLSRYEDDARAVIRHPSFSLPFMQPGRLVHIKDGSRDFGWGVVVNFQKRVGGAQLAGQRKATLKEGGGDEKADEELKYVIDVLLHCAVADPSASSTAPPVPASEGANGEMVVVPVALSTLSAISSVRIHVAKDLRPPESRATVLRTVREVIKRFPEGVPLLDPIEDMGISDEAFKKLMTKVKALRDRLASHRLSGRADLPSLLAAYSTKAAAIESVRTARRALTAAASILHMDELKARKRVLRRLGFTSAAASASGPSASASGPSASASGPSASGNDVIELKGRVACEISTGDELLLTELIFDGAFSDLSAEQCAALLACCVFDEKAEEDARLRPELEMPLQRLRDAARRIARVATECKLQTDEEAYVKSFKASMMEVVYQWAKGASFAQVLKMTDVFEGSIIRCIKRLEELLRQMADAAKAIGNEELEHKFNKAVTLIKRDIVFAASLYL